MSTSNSTQPPQPPGPDVLFERKQTAEKTLGATYEAKIGPLKARIREVARESNLSLELAYCQIEVGAKAQERIHLSAALFDCLNDSAQAGYEARQEEAKTGDKPKKAPKPPPPPSWIRQIGRGNVIRAAFDVPTLFGVEAWRDRCRQHKAGLGMLQPRVEGVCEIGCAKMAEFEDLNRFQYGEYVVFGWVVQTRKVNAKTLQAEIEFRIQAAKKKAEAEGGKLKGEEKTWIKNDCKEELFRKAVPNTLVHPVVVDVDRGLVWFHGSEEAWAAFSKAFNLQFRRNSILGKCDEALINALATVTEKADLRKPEGLKTANNTKAKAAFLWEDAHRDFLLWLVLAAKSGAIGAGLTHLSWEVDDLKLESSNPRNEMHILASDTGALMAALAEGASVRSLELCVTQEIARVAVEGQKEEGTLQRDFCYGFQTKGTKEKHGILLGKVNSLPVGSVGELSGAVTERILSYELLQAILRDLYGAFAVVRTSDAWQDVIDAGRKWVGLELMRRFVFDEASGQGWLFKPQALLPVEEKSSSKRGKK